MTAMETINKNPYFTFQVPEETTTQTSPSGVETDNPALIPGLTSIIILCHNTDYSLFHYTGNCIGSVKEHTKLPYEIILVDNGSTVKPGKLSDYKVDKLVVNEENKGVSVGWNQGVRVSSGEYICFLNNDAMVFDNWLEDLQEALQQVELVMATPMYGEPFSRAVEAAQKRALWNDQPIDSSFSDFRDFSCVLAKKELFNEVGLFDEQFFAYCEDLDFMRRMDQLGKKYASTKKVNIYHVIGATTTADPRTPELMNESKQKLKEKWGE